MFITLLMKGDFRKLQILLNGLGAGIFFNPVIKKINSALPESN
jgi:hypothetical protein